MNYTSCRLFIIIYITIFTTACTTAKLRYHLDPEISQLDQLSSYVEIISISVSDKRPTHAQLAPNDENTIIVENNSNDAEALKKKIIAELKENNFKIISNPLLADLSIKIEIEQLSVNVVKSFFKSEVTVKSELLVKVNKQSQQFKKRYSMNRQQEVVNPPSEKEVTGVVNQLISKQLTSIVSDSTLIKLLKK